jgi:hypothetical protein|tara:strand:+ start:121 stop:330 length:210 start_codon:yes stop_codon:yes gene_type:complete
MKTAEKLRYLKSEMLEMQVTIESSLHWSIKEGDSGNEDMKEYKLFQMRIEQARLESLEDIFDEVLSELN